jgi:hypothetical protein
MMKERKRPQCLWLTVGFAVSVPIQSQAIEATDVLLFSKGPVSLRPQFTVVETFNDNVFFGDNVRIARESDFITGFSPGFNLLVGDSPENTLKLSYAYDRFIYAIHPDLGADQHRASLYDHFEYHRFTIVGSDRTEFLTSILGGGYGLNENVTRLINYHDYNIQYAISEKTGVYVEGQYSATDYRSGFQSELFDTDTLTGTVGFTFKALPKTSFFGEIYYGQTATTPNISTIKPPHADFVGGFIGAKGEFTPHLTGTVKAGYEVRYFSDNGPGLNAPVVSASLEQRFTEKTAVTLNYSRRPEVSVQYSRVSYVIDAADLSLSQILGTSGRLRASAQAGFDNIAYDELLNNRLDRILRIGANLNYQIRRWATAGLAYNFEHFSSDTVGVIDYNVNRVTLMLAIGF